MRKTGFPGVYIIKNSVNNKCYIGASGDTYNRLCMHKVHLRKGTHINCHLQAAYLKYGESSFIFETIEYCDIKDIFKREHYYCLLYKSHDRKFGYNIDPTSEIGKCAVSEETRVKMSEGAEKRKIFVYTVYGDFFREFSDFYKCGDYFHTAPPNIHRKMNILFNKKNLIDSEMTKYLFTDPFVDISNVKIYWNDIFCKLQECSGKYTIHNCFNDYIGTATSKQLCDILNVEINSISTSVRRGTYLKTLKITKC